TADFVEVPIPERANPFALIEAAGLEVSDALLRAVAKANGLDSLWDLEPGQPLYLPSPDAWRARREAFATDEYDHVVAGSRLAWAVYQEQHPRRSERAAAAPAPQAPQARQASPTRGGA